MTPEQLEIARETMHDIARGDRMAASRALREEQMAEFYGRAESCDAAAKVLTPEAEADRRLGAAVRNSAPQSFDLATTLTEAARELDGVQFPIAAGALRAIAAALREDAGR